MLEVIDRVILRAIFRDILTVVLGFFVGLFFLRSSLSTHKSLKIVGTFGVFIAMSLALPSIKIIERLVLERKLFASLGH